MDEHIDKHSDDENSLYDQASQEILELAKQVDAQPDKTILEIISGLDEPPSEIMSAEVIDTMLAKEALRVSEEDCKKDALIKKLQAGAELRFRKALDMGSKVHNEKRRATILKCRHNERLKGIIFVKCLEDLSGGDSNRVSMAREALEELQKDIEENGVFLIEYDDELMEERLSPGRYSWRSDPEKKLIPEYIVAESWGRHPDPDNPLHTKKVVAADCQIHLPLPKRDVLPVVEIPTDEDILRNSPFIEYLNANPYAVALIEDIVCQEEMGELRLASVAMSKALRHIMEANKNRKRNRITHVATSIADLRGIRKPDGTEIMLKEDLGLPPICNERSLHLFSHFKSNYYTPFKTAFILKNRTVPIEFRGERYEIILDWIVKASALKDPNDQK